jgi:hypothetical protein
VDKVFEVMEVYEVFEVKEIWLVVQDFQPLQKVWGFRLPMLVFSPNIKEKISKGAPWIPDGGSWARIHKMMRV